MLRTYRTPKGTELPLLNLRGKEYLEVKYRLVWFREDHPDWAIETELLAVNPESAYSRATVKDEHGRVIATSHKFESKKGFPDFIEKAETGAIGRALALIGYGTQFCADELDEGDRIVDAPVEARRNDNRGEARRAPVSEIAAKTAKPLAPAKSAETEPAPVETATAVRETGDYRISFGKKYKGMKLRDIPRMELEGYMEWLEENAAQKGLPLSEEARFLKVAVGRFLNGSAKNPAKGLTKDQGKSLAGAPSGGASESAKRETGPLVN